MPFRTTWRARLDQHFASPENQNAEEYERIYKIFGCRDYYDRMITAFEQSPTDDGKPAYLSLLTTMAMRDKDDPHRYQILREKIFLLQDHEDSEFNSSVADSLGRLVRRVGDKILHVRLLRVLLRRAEQQGESASTPWSYEERFALDVLAASHTHVDEYRDLLPLFRQSGTDDALRAKLIETLETKTWENEQQIIPYSMAEAMTTSLEGGNSFDWSEVEAVQAVLRISNGDVRERAFQVLDQRNSWRKVLGVVRFEEMQARFEHIPPEALLQVVTLNSQGPGFLEKMNHMFATVRSSRLRDSLIFSLTHLAEGKAKDTALTSSVIQELAQISWDGPTVGERLSGVLKAAVFLGSVSYLLSPHKAESRSTPQQAHLPTPATNLDEFGKKLKVAVVEKIQAVIPDVRLTLQHIDFLWEQWPSLDPLFIYASKVASLSNREMITLLGDAIVHFDPPHYAHWRAWRYGQGGEVVISERRKGFLEKQIGQLRNVERDTWCTDFFCELGQVFVNLAGKDPAPAVRAALRNALHHRHLFDPGRVGTQGERFVQDTLSDVFRDLADEGPQVSVKLDSATSQLQSTLDTIDTEIRYREKDRVAQIGDVLTSGTKVDLNAKTRGMLDMLERYLESADIETLRAARRKAEEAGIKKFDWHELVPLELQARVSAGAALVVTRRATLVTSESYTELGLQELSPGQIYALRKQVASARSLCLLANLRSTDAAQGKIGGTSQPLSDVFKDLRAFFRSNTVFLQDLDNIERATKVGPEEPTRRRLGIVFTDNPEILLQIGKYPIGCGSCQNYEGDVSLNAALLGYLTDAHIKAALIVDLDKLPTAARQALQSKSGARSGLEVSANELLTASVGRSIVKLVKDRSQRTAVFLEPTYTSLNKANLAFDRYFNMFFEHVVARPMGARIMRGGGGETVHVPPSQNPAGQYEDSAAGGAHDGGMGVKQEEYSMPAHEVQSTQPTTREEAEIALRIQSSSSRAI